MNRLCTSISATALALLTLAACAPLQQLHHDGLAFSRAAGVTSAYQVERENHWVLPHDTRFYVALDGSSAAIVEAQPVASDVGQTGELPMLADLLAGQMSQRFPYTVLAGQPESLPEARSSARRHAADYVLYSRLLVWEDSAKAWRELGDALRFRSDGELLSSLGPDRVRLQLTLVDAVSGDIVDVTLIAARSGALTLYQDPQGLLAAAIDQYADRLSP